MSIKQEKFCRLCLKVVTNEFTEVDEVIRQMFHIFLLKLDVNIIREAIICRDCVEIAKKCLTFKLTCFCTERTTLLFSAGRENAEHDIKIICKEKEGLETVRDEDLNVCQICMTRLQGNNFAFLDTLKNEITMFNIFTKYILEMDFNLMGNPKICTTCRENLKGYMKFVMNCLDMEQRIKSFCKNKRNNNMDQVYSGCLQQFLFKDNLAHPDKYYQVCAIKEESTMFEDTKCIYPGACGDLIKLEELDIKQEVFDSENKRKILSEMDLDKDMFLPKEFDKEAKHTISLNAKEGNTRKWFYRKKIQRCLMEDNSNQDTLEVNENENSGIQINKGAVYTDDNKEKKITNRDLITNLDTSKTYVYKYTLPASDNMQQNVLRIGIVMSHGKEIIDETYKCSLCAYETKHKKNLKYHELIHKDVSEIKMYECSFCGFKTKRKDSLKNHMLIHKDVSEIKMYKCSLCAYETRYKDSLRKHMIIHKDVSDIKRHKCPLCPHEAKQKQYLRRHMLVHKDVSDIKMHKCPLCPHEAKQKYNLSRHMLVHKDISQIKMHKCSFCAYEAKQKYNVTKHTLVVHKDISEITMHKCSLCTYEAKYTGDLNRHMLVHKDVSEIKMHKCSLCNYVAKLKYRLTKHMVVHKDVSEIKIHKCLLCAHQTKHKRNLKKHMLVHKDVSEVKMHKCSFCAYKAKQKGDLKRHLLVHKDVSEITRKICINNKKNAF